MDVPTNAPLAIPESLLAEINAAADEECWPPGELVQGAIQRHVDERAWKKIFAYGEAQAKALGLHGRRCLSADRRVAAGASARHRVICVAQVHAESGEIFDEITRIAHNAGLDIVHDATLKTGAKATTLVKKFKESGYRVEAHYMHLPRQEAAKRAVGRFLGKTKRYVPPAVILSNTANEANFDSIKPMVDAGHSTIIMSPRGKSLA
jgi:hypothetical protein